MRNLKFGRIQGPSERIKYTGITGIWIWIWTWHSLVKLSIKAHGSHSWWWKISARESYHLSVKRSTWWIPAKLRREGGAGMSALARKAFQKLSFGCLRNITCGNVSILVTLLLSWLIFNHLNEMCQLTSEICGEMENCTLVWIQRKALTSDYFSCRQVALPQKPVTKCRYAGLLSGSQCRKQTLPLVSSARTWDSGTKAKSNGGVEILSKTDRFLCSTGSLIWKVRRFVFIALFPA